MFVIAKKQSVLGVAISAGLCAMILGWLYLRHLENTFQAAAEPVSALVATRYVPRGIPLRPSFFQVMMVPKAYAQPGTVSSFELMESSPGHPRFRNAIPLPAGSQLVQNALVPLSVGEGLSQVIPEDRVAVSFGVDSVHGVGGNIRPGDLVNILHTSRGSETEPSHRVTDTLFQAVPVVAVGKKWISPERLAAGESEKDARNYTDNSGDETVLTVLLHPLPAVRLVQARENESLSVVLRAPGDDRILESLP